MRIISPSALFNHINNIARFTSTRISLSRKPHVSRSFGGKLFSASTGSNMASSAVSKEPVTFQGKEYRVISEGLARNLGPYLPPLKQNGNKKGHNNDEGQQAVFYNPIQQYNRDLSVLAITVYGESALFEKKAALAKKEHARKRGKKSKQKAKVDAGVEGVESDSAGVSKKRKADDLDEPAAQNGVNGKKVKTGNDDVEEDNDELEVQQLEPDDDVNIVTEHENGVKPTESLPKVDSVSEAVSEESKVPFTILDALSATGLRAIRYAKEIPFVTNVVANDWSADAVTAIELNIDHNKVRDIVHSNVGDARSYMYGKTGNGQKPPHKGHVHKFDVVDLDPYGTAAPFLDSAVQALADRGMLCVTCTDAGVFASNGYPEKAFSLYGGVTMKGPFSHEAGLRLILHAVASSAARYGIAIEPLLSLSVDFYARLFVRVHKQPMQVKTLAGTTMITYNCDYGCGAWKTQLLARNQEKKDKIGQTYFKHSYSQGPSTSPMCEHCGSKTHLGGPMWAGPLHNPYFVQRILDRLPSLDTKIYGTTDRIRGMLTLALEEDLTMSATNASSTVDKAPAPTQPEAALIPRLPPQTIDSTPFFFIPNYVSKVLHCATPPEDHLRGAIRHLGYKVTRSHCKAGSFKTDAPWDVIWEVMREWIRQESPVKEGKVTKGMAGWRIMQKMRGSDAKNTVDIHESIKHALQRGVEGKAELRSLLESGLYRLEHPKTEDLEGTKASDNASEIGVENANGASPKPAWNEPRDVSKLKVVFDTELGKEKPRGKLIRYQINPRANWGPMNRAGA